MSRQRVQMQLASFVGAILILICVDVSSGDRAQPSYVADHHRVDTATQLHVYSYTLSNPSANTAPLETLVIKLQPGVNVVTDFESPVGWRVFYSSEQGTVMWAATAYVNDDDEDDSGILPASDFAVKPGESLPGFSFKSFGPPGVGVAITQSYAPLYAPQSGEDFEVLEAMKEVSTLPEDNGYRLTTVVPVPYSDWTGNRRPSVDGFLVFANVQPRTAYAGSVLIVFRLGGAGELVDASSLRVSLNGTDVVQLFEYSELYKGYAAVFSGNSTFVRSGTNVLRTSVEGIVPGTTKRATDTDRITFEFVP